MSNAFPAFLSIEYDGRGDGFPAFERAADTAFSHVEGRARQFSSSIENVQQIVARALSSPRNAGGSLDLNVPELKAAAEAAQARALAAREVATATRLAAEAEGDYSQTARQAIGATEAVAREHEEAARSARSYARCRSRCRTSSTGRHRKHKLLSSRSAASQPTLRDWNGRSPKRLRPLVHPLERLTSTFLV